MTSESILSLQAIGKRFPAVAALTDASLDVRAGTIHAMLGENGAGKTTLMRIAYGVLQPDAGTILLDGVAQRLASPRDAIARGIGMVHQHFSLVPSLTVAENVALGGRGRFDRAAAAARVDDLSQRTGLPLAPNALAAELSVTAQQRVEIVRALASNARVLILDEPTAVLPPDDAHHLLEWLRRFVRAGNAAILITHKLREALTYADHITVLRQGRTIRSGPVASFTDAALATAMLGDAAGIPIPGARHPALARGIDRVQASGLTVCDERGVARVREATFEIAAGEIVGLAAVEDSGQAQLLRAVAGRTRPSGGELRTPDRVAFIPEDRHREALMLDASLTENVALRNAGERRGRMDWRALRAVTERLMAAFDVRAPGPSTTTRQLSGGNQQRLVLARELEGDPELVVAENPTRGLDVRATAAVHAHLRAARDRGAAVLVAASDLDEVIALADRVLVIHGGRVVERPADRTAVGRAMLGVT